MGELAEFLSDVPGYFREGAENQFPWSSTDRFVWYALLNIENGQIVRYGFTSAKGQKAALLNALNKASTNSLLLGVWTGSYRTDLFVLEKEKAKEELKRMIPMERLGQPEDVAKGVFFLVSEASSYMTGQAINVTGGQEMH